MNIDRNKTTAKEAYDAHRADIEVLLDWLGMELDTHEQNSIDEPKNWGLANEIGHVKTQLKQTLAFLSGNEVAEINQALEELRM